MVVKGVFKTVVSTLSFLTLLLVPVLAGAGDITMGVAYTPEELAAVRAWEKTWAGKKIDAATIDQVAEFMPESYVGIYKEPQKWGAPEEGYFFYIVPYQQVNETEKFIAATKKYAPLVKRDAEGVITNIAEIAGRPFPQPKDGLEIAYNYDLNSKGDTYRYRKYSPNINPKTKTERMADQEYWEFYFINRCEIDPVPAILKNKKGYRRGMFLHMYKPAEFLNTRMYTLRYIDPQKDDDTYLWYSQFRRIRRLSTAQRTDSIDGSDLIYDDEYFWDGQILRNTYTFRGKRELLCSRHEELKKTTRQAGQGLLNGLHLERCNTLVVDAVNKDKNYLYGKRVWYIDPESYIIQWTEIYDELGRFWKCYIQHTAMLKTKQGAMKHSIVGSEYQDFQRTHSGLNDSCRINDPVVGINITPRMFTISNLQKTY